MSDTSTTGNSAKATDDPATVDVDVQDPLPDGNRHLGQKWGDPVTAAG